MAQTYFANVLLDYIREFLCTSHYQFLPDEKKFVAEAKRLKTIYSRRRMFLFIGKLMILSGLLTMKKKSAEEEMDDKIIQVIQKKLSPKLRAEKRKLKAIREHNQNPTDGSVIITPAEYLF